MKLISSAKAERALADKRVCPVCRLPKRALQNRTIPSWACTACHDEYRRHRGYPKLPRSA